MFKKVTILTSLFVLLSCVAGAVLLPKLTSAQARTQSGSQSGSQGKSVYSGNIFYIGGPRTMTDTFRLTITSLTPEAEVSRLKDLLKNEGQDDFQRVIGKEKRGTIQIGTGLGLDLNAVWVSQTEEGRKIYALAERWMGFGELRRGARSTDYPFTYIELWAEEDGDVEGTLFPAARVRARNNNTIEVENFGIYPARLTNVKERKK